MLTQEQCPTCKGVGELDYAEERDFDGIGWRRRSRDSADPLWDDFVKARPDLARWEPGPCEVCHGDGKIEIEHFTCKIY